jgi:hypothetical protein
MTKLEELKAAYDAATDAAWVATEAAWAAYDAADVAEAANDAAWDAYLAELENTGGEL